MQIKIAKSKGRMLLGGILAAAAFAFCIGFGGSGKAALVLACGMLALGFVQVELPNRGISRLFWSGMLLGAGFVDVCLAQICMNEGVSFISPAKMLLGALCCLAVVLLILAITLRVRTSIAAGTILALLLATTNYFVYSFRGGELQPLDFLYAKVALSVSRQYRFHVEPCVIYAWCIGVAFVLLVMAFRTTGAEKPRRPVRNRCLVAAVLLAVILGLGCGSGSVDARNWKKYGTIYNGFFLNFYLQMENAIISEPDGYDPRQVEALAAEYPSQTKDGNTPNIIVIMNESFADLGIYAEEMSAYTPFFHSLEENTVRGYALTSVFGGNTPNAEYEFLTGNSLGFLPNGTVPYQGYIRGNTYSMVSNLDSLGYTCVAMHPFYADGWMRQTVYPYLGFGESHFLEDFPQEQLLREYVSDREMYEQVTARFEAKAEGEPLFLFGITMQNHGGYEYEGEHYEKTVTLEGFDANVAKAEQYLSLLRESDRALEYLIGYFAEVEEPTLIVFYGDHQPSLDPPFLQELYGGEFEMLDDRERMYTVPFLIWTNYEIPERVIELTSLNYLSNYVYEAAEIPLPAYQRFLADMENVVPAMNMLGYYSQTSGCFLPYSEARGEEARWLKWYEILQYNCLFDSNNRSAHFFPALT